MEDVRLCRFPTTDSKQTEYPWQSPYAYYANSPIKTIDFNGEGDPLDFIIGMGSASGEKVDAQIQAENMRMLDENPGTLIKNTLIGGATLLNESLKTVFGTFTNLVGWKSDPMGWSKAYQENWEKPLNNLFNGDVDWEQMGYSTGMFVQRTINNPLNIVGAEFSTMLKSPSAPSLKAYVSYNATKAVTKYRLIQLQYRFALIEHEFLIPKYKGIDPNAKFGYTGSFKTGVIGNKNSSSFKLSIDLKNFDIDYFIESDILHKMNGNNLKADVSFRRILNNTKGFEGLRPNKEGFSILFKKVTKSSNKRQ